ncbi:hypothetical protein ACFY2R_24240 [Micromonospora olivasterospora]|uniref:Uncharacterized protein n=1 Tax=Micromonospora olivasterospora TaxID=1880 RepID=A0A562I951_MICOL|nr:hypothetical protein [Micromonospora olivasterospora]TWH67255.1 hypothetical protein JD77_02227 [Micromonospora olivasterospora]
MKEADERLGDVVPESKCVERTLPFPVTSTNPHNARYVADP